MQLRFSVFYEQLQKSALNKLTMKIPAYFYVCRSEMNILLCGDPGTSKSQLLQYVHNLVPRGQYTSGKGSSATGGLFLINMLRSCI